MKSEVQCCVSFYMMLNEANEFILQFNGCAIYECICTLCACVHIYANMHITIYPRFRHVLRLTQTNNACETIRRRSICSIKKKPRKSEKEREREKDNRSDNFQTKIISKLTSALFCILCLESTLSLGCYGNYFSGLFFLLFFLF